MGLIWAVGGRRQAARAERSCSFERMESRQMLASDLVAGAEIPGLDSPGAMAGSIRGSVFANRAGTTAGLADVRVQLLGETGVVIDERRTDAQGSYAFDGLLPGVYAVQEITPTGFSDGLSQAGSGGGMVLNANLFGEIVVGAGDSLSGYDFYDVVTVEQNSDGDRRIDTQGGPGMTALAALQILSLSLQSSVEKTNESIIPTSSATSIVDRGESTPDLKSTTREEPIFGGSSQVKKRTESARELEDASPFDDLFSLTGFWELASANLPEIEPLNQLINNVGSELQELLFEGREAESAATEQPPQPRIARRNETATNEAAEPETDADNSMDNRRASHDSPFVEALDEVFAVEDLENYQAKDTSEAVTQAGEEPRAPHRQAS